MPTTGSGVSTPYKKKEKKITIQWLKQKGQLTNSSIFGCILDNKSLSGSKIPVKDIVNDIVERHKANIIKVIF